MNIKVTIHGKDWGYWTVEDYSDYKDAFETDAEFLEYVTEGCYYPDKFGDFESGFVISILESITQSDYCPPYLYEKDIVKVEVTHVHYAVEDSQ